LGKQGESMKKTITKKEIVFLIAGLVVAQGIYANPKGANVVSGQASLAHPSVNALTITNTPGAIINWQSFDINPNEITRFIQQNGASAVLNRVVGNGLTASQIMGTLASNGKVFLINPNGIVFGANSVVDTAGLIASSLNISDQDFLNNNLRFDGNADNGAIDNKGYITAGLNGDVFLIAPNIENSGIIETNGGHIILAAGEKVSLASFENENIVFQVQSSDNKVTNLGSLMTNGGAAEIFAGTITHSGSINANSVSVNDAGKVTLAAISDITIEKTAVITANGNNGGEIRIESDSGDTIVKGSLEVNGTTGKGGAIHVLGERVGLFDNALVSANGKMGGGEVLIGGGFQGKSPEIKNAKQTAVGDDAIIKANATDIGDGGKVIVWADDFTQFHGSIEATGGEDSGNGGFVEVSGKENFLYRGEIDVTAAQGSSGSVLFDPKNLTVRIDVPTDDLATNNEFAENSTGSAAIDPTDVINLLDAGTAVTLQASNDLAINEDITVTGAGATFTLQAGRSVSIGADITTNGGNFNATANSSLADGVVDGQRDAGAAEFRLSSGNTIDTDGGDITIEVSDGAGLTNSTSGNLVLEELSFVEADGGSIDLKSRAGSVVLEGSGTSGARLESLAGTGGNITITADDLDVQPGSIITTPGTFSGNLTIVPFSTNQDISIGTAGAGTPLEITAAELSRMTAIDTLTIGRSTDTGTLTIAENLTSAGINAATLELKHQNITANNAIDLSAGGENLQFTATNLVDLNNAVDAGTVTIEAPNASFSPVTTINVDTYTGTGGAVAPTLTTFDGAGITLFRSSVTLAAVTHSVGTIESTAGQAVTINGTYNWSGGMVDTDINSNGTTNITGSVRNDKTFTNAGTMNIGADYSADDGILINNSTVNWTAGDIVELGGGASITNNGTFNISGNGANGIDFTNNGTFSKTAGGATTSFTGSFTNTDTVNASSGLLQFNGYTQTTGLTKLAGGNIGDTSGTSNINGGTLSGVGSFTVGDLNINGATLAPGASPGTLNIVGNLNLGSTSTTLIELGGTTQGTNYDFINVTGNVALDGTLNVSLFGGFTGVAGNQFDIISSGTNTMTGSFANTIFPTGYTFSQGIIGGGAFYQLGLLVVPVIPTSPELETQLLQEQTTNEVLVLEENFDAWNREDIFGDKKTEEYDDQAQICT
jgi:filamentous hemagglutinin family protein